MLSAVAIVVCSTIGNNETTLEYGQIDVTRHPVLVEFFNGLSEALTAEDIEIVKNTELDDLAMFHFGLGMMIRNGWLWSQRPNCVLIETIEELVPSLQHIDNMSYFLIVAYHYYLNGLPLSVEMFVEHRERERD